MRVEPGEGHGGADGGAWVVRSPRAASREPGRRARSSERTPYQVRKATPAHRTTSTAQPARSTTAPMPATPATISTRSETAHTATTGPTCRRTSPCRSTNAFCAPMAMMRPSR